MSEDQKFEKLNMEMFTKFMEENPTYATFLGLHDPYDWLMSDGSSKNIFKSLKIAEEWIGKMKRTVNYEKLSADHKIDWKVIEQMYEKFKFQIYEQRVWETNPDAFDEVGGVFFIMLTRNYAPMEKRVDAMVARMEKLPKFLEEFRTRFDKSKPVKLWTEIAIESCQQIPGLFQFLVAATKGAISDELHSRLTKAVADLQKPIKDHQEWLNSLLPKTQAEWALGKEKFDKWLKLRGLGMTADEIYKLGTRFLEELKQERDKLAKQIAPGKSVKEVMEVIEANAPKTFEEALKATKVTMEKSRDFIIKSDLATVYPDDKLHVEETPAFMAPIIPFAALIPPAKFDKRQEGIYIVTRPRDIKNLGKHLNYASISGTAVHEGFPGHFLQGAMSNRGSLVRLFAGGNEVIEGWAHYCEEMMTEHGFIKGLESRFMMVNDGIWRAVRIIVDIKLSRGEMAFDEAVDMLMKEAGMSKEAAVAEVRRYTMTPGYPLSYLIGKHLILQLRADIMKRMGKKFSERFFHDTMTANGELPIALLREVFDIRLAELGIG
ncbi:MAG TPA: DUF885 domain-containing protein [Candidatus Bathyarchaeia archaeon]|nr:DUF885 domain-containing protein [Candidatus Bathyarchaeia archaeon]